MSTFTERLQKEADKQQAEIKKMNDAYERGEQVNLREVAQRLGKYFGLMEAREIYIKEYLKEAK